MRRWKKKEIQNRLARLLKKVADEHELTCKIDNDGLGGEVIVPVKGGYAFANYTFDEKEDWYDFGAVIKPLDGKTLEDASYKVLTSPPIRGLTERIDNSGRLSVNSGRDNLVALADLDIETGYMEDMARIAEAFDQYRGLT